MQTLRDLSVLLTDPDSFLGRRVADRLSEMGWKVVGLDPKQAFEGVAEAAGMRRPNRMTEDVSVIIDLGQVAGTSGDVSAAAERTATLIAGAAAPGAPRRYVLLDTIRSEGEDGPTNDAGVALLSRAGSLDAVILRTPFIHGRDVPAALDLVRRYLAGEVAPAGTEPVQWIHADDLADALVAAGTRAGLRGLDLTVADPFAIPETVLDQELARLDRLLTDKADPEDQPRPDYPLLPPQIDTEWATEALGVRPRRDFWVGLAETVQAIRLEGRRPIGGPAATPALALARGDTPALGQVVVITGATAGIGRATALELAKLGARIIAVGRDEKAGESLVDQIADDGRGSCAFLPADLSVMTEVRRLASRICESTDRIDVLINGAAVMLDRLARTEEGHERMWATNHLAPFLLTNLLSERLRAATAPRIVNVSCEAHRRGAADAVVAEPRDGLEPFDAYCRSKLAGVMFTYALARRVGSDDFTVLAAHPGEVTTGLATRDDALPPDMLARFAERAIPVEVAARHLVCFSIAPRYRGLRGKYFMKNEEARSAPVTYDDELSEQLWKESAEHVGLI